MRILEMNYRKVMEEYWERSVRYSAGRSRKWYLVQE